MEEWVDGFLFVGNHPSLDLLNTRLVDAGGPVELLPDAGALTRWLIASGVVKDESAVAKLQRWRDSRQMRELFRGLLGFREQLRAVVLDSGEMREPFLGELNEKLLTYPRRYVLERTGSDVKERIFFDLKRPEDVWSEIAASASDLLTKVPFSRVRQCEGCVVNFFDTSRKGSRRWCSMKMCGNREKVANYRRSQRA
jgi:predicted RNA-binding Zn ribbon-like protein